MWYTRYCYVKVKPKSSIEYLLHYQQVEIGPH